MFELAGHRFAIASARLDAFVDAEEMVLSWGLEVQAKHGAGKFAPWAPKVSSECFLASRPGDFKDWRELSGTEVSWSEPYDANGEHYALLYVFEHLPVRTSRVLIGSGTRRELMVRWEGLSDVNWKSKDDEGVEFSITEDLEFTGVWFGRKPEAECARLLSRFLDVGLFDFDVTEHGVSIYRPKEGVESHDIS